MNQDGMNSIKRKEKMWKALYILIPILGFFPILYYTLGSTADVIYSDYIRLVNSYMPDPLDPKKFFTADICTRIPCTYIFRWINFKLFSYSVDFDRVLCVLGLSLMGISISLYAIRERFPFIIYLSIIFVAMSLNKWEMLLNGSGYIHFLSFAGFYYIYLILDRVYTATAKKYDKIKLSILPAFMILAVAGPYSGVFTVVMILSYLFILISGNKNIDKKFVFLNIVLTAFSFFIYYISYTHAEYVYDVKYELSLVDAISRYPKYLVHFLLNGLASTILGGECIEELLVNEIISYRIIYIVGILVFMLYLFATFLYFKEQMYKRTLVPMILILSGAGSHLIVLISRYIFLNETYAWSSRYVLQYQSGIIGILFVFAIYRKTHKGFFKKNANRIVRLIIAFSVSILLIGNIYTCRVEIYKSPYRKAYFENMREMAYNYESMSDEEMEWNFEYFHQGPYVRHAFDLIKEHKLNIYKEN